MKIQVSQIVEHQLPSFIKEEYPLFVEFLKQYYLSTTDEIQLQNLEKNIDFDIVFNIRPSATLFADIGYNDATIVVDSTSGFPDNYGLIQIDDEIILYETKTETQFLNCTRGFSGVNVLTNKEFEFSNTEKEKHTQNTSVYNLSILLLQQFAINIKKHISPGFEERDLFSGLNQSNFLKKINNFYLSKGSDEAFRILFAALYGEKIQVIRPQDFLIRPSDAQWRVTKDIIVEVIEGDPYQLQNLTLYQDATSFIEPAQGTIVQVQKLNEFYLLSLDYDYNKDIDFSGTTKSEFSIHPRTKVTSNVITGQSYVDVDSTIGFPDSGTIKIGNNSITYQSKTINQFLECSNITEDILASSTVITEYFVYGFGVDGNQVTMRVLGTPSGFDILDQSYNYSVDEKIKIKTLGEDSKLLKANNWFFNIPVSYKVENIQPNSSSNFSYLITLYDNHTFVLGDTFTLSSSDGTLYYGEVSGISNQKSIIIVGQGQLNLNPNIKYSIKKNISKVKVQNQKYKNIEIYNSNVQNTYLDYDNNIYISATSLPKYVGNGIVIEDFITQISAGVYDTEEITFTQNHPYFTGDCIVCLPFDEDNSVLLKGVYYVYVINSQKIKLAKSYNDLINNRFVTLSGTLLSGYESILVPFDFVDDDLNQLELLPQQEIKKVLNSTSIEKGEETSPGKIGVFINGVDLVNYKSNDLLFYGGIEEVNVIKGGSGYSVLNPPVLNVTDGSGSGAELLPAVVGSLDKINILDPGFDYLETPTISISGGGGIGAEAVVKLSPYTYSLEFDATKISTGSNYIEFNDLHKFQSQEEVIYSSNEELDIEGLVTGSTYYIQVIDETKIKLHYTYSDSVNKVNEVNLTSIGTSFHKISCKNLKKKIGSIEVLKSGQGYKNKKVKVSGINTISNEIEILNHKYTNGEIISYYPEQTTISGLTSSTSYYVTVIDEDKIKLSGISTIGNPDVFYNRQQYLELGELDTNNHYFNYPKISVNIFGKIGISTSSQETYSAQLQPVFSGEIYSVFIENLGSNYGEVSVLNYERTPDISVEEGSNALVSPVISNGSIEKVIIKSPGDNYQQIPDLIIDGAGTGAILTPVLLNNKLIEVKVINGGSNYTSTTRITVISKGSNAKFSSKLQSRRINLVEKLKYLNRIPLDDGYLFANYNSLQYSHLYSPRELRKIVYRNNIQDLVYNGVEIFNQNTTPHSPILGWAYDGNPIYGPYGYSTPSSGRIRRLKSGYTYKTDSKLIEENRPSFDVYPKGFFVEDYEFTNSGDLDEYNGRYCITPEFPDGTYAYFCTIDDTITDIGPFATYFEPQFPYVIGNSYKNKKVEQVYSFDILGDKVLRNTSPHNLNSTNSDYDYIFGKNSIEKDCFKISKTGSSFIDSIEIKNLGKDYKVDDFIIISDGTFAQVDSISGVAVSSISTEITNINYVEVVPYNNRFIGITTVPHNLTNNESLTFNPTEESSKKIVVQPFNNVLILSSYVDETVNTGISTYFSVIGSLDFPLRENDIFEINNNEQIKVLDIYKDSSKIKVLRNINSVSGIQSYLPGTELVSKSRKFLFNSNFENSYNFKTNKELYFYPQASLGIGTVGISTVFLEPVSIGKTFVEIPARTAYLQNHNLTHREKVFYSSNGETSIEVSIDGTNNFFLQENQELFVNKINKDLIGLSTSIDLSSNLYFVSIGSSNNHSLKTNYDNILYGDLSKIKVNTSLVEDHNLKTNDKIFIDINSGISTEVKVFYNEFNRKLSIDPLLISSVDVIRNNLIVPNHKLTSGQKIIYVSNNVISGLQSQKEYEVIVVSNDVIKLSNFEEEINLTSSGDGFIYKVYPKISLIKGQDLVFDVSDSSLSFVFGGLTYSAFDLKFYKDASFVNEYFTPKIIKTGRVGIDSSAKVTIRSEDLIQPLYYKLVPINTTISPEIKKSILAENSSNVIIENSKFSGSYSITTTSSNSFYYKLDTYPEEIQYSNIESEITYTTNSDNTRGSIETIKILNYKENINLPYIENISTDIGTGSVLVPLSKSIGSISKINKTNNYYTYSSDFTVRPKLISPQILEVEPLYSLESIEITSKGKNYIDFPDLILVNGDTKIPYNNVELEYNNQKNTVSIIKNTNQIDPANPQVIFINNDNGFEIQDISYDNNLNSVTVTLKTGFTTTTDYPFSIGEQVFIENVVVVGTTTTKGYNSVNYDYAMFEIISSDPKIGGIGATFTYSLNNILPDGFVPGIQDKTFYSGSVIPKSYLPEFQITLKSNEFFIGEKVNTSSGQIGEVTRWDKNNNILNVLSNNILSPEDIIYGESSKTKTTITSSYIPRIYSNIKSNDIVDKGWNRNTGFLNDTEQRIHDNDYYQYFSYDIRSGVDYSNWSDIVDSLSHPAGFKKFGNMLVDSNQLNVGITTDQDFGEFEIVNDLIGEVSLNCFSDYDLVTENYFYINNKVNSNEIYFNSKIIQDYIQSKSNKVLLIDDISGSFVGGEVPENAIIDVFKKLDIRFKKYLIHIYDRFFLENSQSLAVTLLHDGTNISLNQYAIVESNSELGYIDAAISGPDVELTFTPIDKINKIYNINLFAFEVSDFIGITTTSLGDVVSIKTNLTSGIGSTTIISVPQPNTAGKIIIVSSDLDENKFYAEEINYLQSGSSIVYNSYGDLFTSSTSGIGTFELIKNGTDFNIISYPNDTTKEYTYNTLGIFISDTTFSQSGELFVEDTLLYSTYKQVTASLSIEKTLIYSYDSNYTSGHHQILVNDTTNNTINYLEIITNLDSKNLNVYSLEFGNLYLNSPIGLFEAEFSTINGNMELYFTPFDNINYEVRMFTSLLKR